MKKILLHSYLLFLNYVNILSVDSVYSDNLQCELRIFFLQVRNSTVKYMLQEDTSRRKQSHLLNIKVILNI